MTPRPARAQDIDAMLDLMSPHVAALDLLPRDRDDLLRRIDEFLLLEETGETGRLVGLAALYHYGPELAEVRSLAVAGTHAGRGFGRMLALELLRKARESGLKKVIALTRRPGFFSGLGFSPTSLEALPEKVRRDCLFCPRRERCDEVAMVYEL
jgi:argininosuccinate lyase/amino-acid N-acetyltransferase